MKLKYNFETPIDFTGINSLKWGGCLERNLTPMWVADMDFQPAPNIRAAIQQYSDVGAYGYTAHPQELTEMIIKRMKKLYGWETAAEDYIFINGIVPALNIICRTCCAPGAEVINFTPVYYHFLNNAGNAGLPTLNIPLLPAGTTWVPDLEVFAQLTKKKPGGVLQFCNPHNPVGKMYTQAELITLGKICLENQILIASDEIHCDLVLNENKKHIPIAALAPELSQTTITMMAPTKTWSTPGMQFSFMIIQNKTLRSKIKAFMKGLFGELTGISKVMALAAYGDKASDEWLQELLVVLRANRDTVFEQLSGIPGFSLTSPIDATYLAWLDYRKSNITDLKAYLEKHAGVVLSDGTPFGGNGYLRLNFATPASILLPALKKIRSALVAIK